MILRLLILMGLAQGKWMVGDFFYTKYRCSDKLPDVCRFLSKKSADWDFDRPTPRKSVDDDIVITTKPKSSYSRDTDTSSQSDEAVKKFGNAKAISSDQYFGANRENDVKI